MVDPDNRNTQQNPVGRFMVAAGAIIELGTTGKILITQRHHHLDWHPGEWELMYGRIAQGETPEQGLRREMKEELGIEAFDILSVVRIWHIYRGSEKPENECVGITYHCRTNSEQVSLSDEHETYQWIDPEAALPLMHVEGIRHDVEAFIARRNVS
jgi:8-oxo-dGTP pyrophosphatase MutT (NUDIX family)